MAPSAEFKAWLWAGGRGLVSEKCCVISQGQRLSLPAWSPSVFQRDLAEALRCNEMSRRLQPAPGWDQPALGLPTSASPCAELSASFLTALTTEHLGQGTAA